MQRPTLNHLLFAYIVALQSIPLLHSSVAFTLTHYPYERTTSSFYNSNPHHKQQQIYMSGTSGSGSNSMGTQSTNNPSSHIKPVLEPCCYKSNIDYSAANEYVYAHYYNNKQQQMETPPSYFLKGDHVTDEPIYDARNHGYYNDEIQAWMKPSLSRCGFTLMHAPTTVTDFQSMEQITQTYLEELRDLIFAAFEKEKDDDMKATVKHLIFWHPMYRGNDCEMSELRKDGAKLSTAPVASLVHIDSDIGAMDVEMLLRLIESNRLMKKKAKYNSNGGGDVNDSTAFPYKELEDDLESGKRFLILNAWRNADVENKRPVERSPLGLLAACFDGNDRDTVDNGGDQYGKHGIFPTNRPNPTTSRWYTYPQMTVDECLLFKQYDRRLDQPSDLWHCALDVNTNKDEKNSFVPPALRRSFDVRAFVVLDETVPPQNDRYLLARRPLLNYEESGCFCDEQTAKRQKEKSSIRTNTQQSSK